MKKLLILCVCLIMASCYLNAQNVALILTRKSRIAFSYQKYDSAWFYVQKAIEIDPKEPEAYLQRSSMYDDKKQDKEAEADLRKVIELAPNHQLANLGMANTLNHKYNDKEGAKKHYQIAISQKPEQDFLFMNYGMFLHYDMKDYKGAKEQYLKAIEVNNGSNLSMAYWGLANLYKDQFNDKEKGKPYYIKATEIDPQYFIKEDFDDFYGIKRENK